MVIVENSLYAGLENDAGEISKIKQDLMALRCEIEQVEQEEFTEPSINTSPSAGTSLKKAAR
jgi:hypothetical protein